MKITREQYDELAEPKKINFANSLSGFKSLNLIATKSIEGIENVGIFSSLTHYGSNPPLFGVTLRPPSPRHQTYFNIKETGLFTVNQVNKTNYVCAHKTSGNYPSEISEFDLCKLERWESPTFDCPYVASSQIKFGLKFVEEHAISNGCVLVIGSLEELHIDDSLVEETGHINHSAAETLTVSGLDSYYDPQFLKRLARVRQ